MDGDIEVTVVCTISSPPPPPPLTYTATVTVTNGIDNGYTPTVTAGSTSFVVDTDPDSGYDLPTTIVVTMGGTTLT